MELKQVYFDKNPDKSFVLIEPLWNWNEKTPRKTPRKNAVLIEPLWNWNKHYEHRYLPDK